MELNVTLFPLAFMAMQISVEYENGGFLSPFFLYCSALSKPGTRKPRYCKQSPDVFWRYAPTNTEHKDDIVVSILTHLETYFVRKFFRVLIGRTGRRVGRIRRRGQRRHRQYVRQAVQPVQAGQVRVRFRGMYRRWKRRIRPLDVQHVQLETTTRIRVSRIPRLVCRYTREKRQPHMLLFVLRVHLFWDRLKICLKKKKKSLISPQGFERAFVRGFDPRVPPRSFPTD